MVWVNFMPWRQRLLRHALHRWLLLFSLPIVIGLSLIALLSRQLNDEVQRWHNHIAQQQAVLVAAESLANRLSQILREQQALQVALQKRQRQMERNRHWHQFVQQLTQLMPETLWLTSIKKAPTGVSITGFCSELAEASEFRRRLVSLPLFQQVDNSRIERQTSGDLQFTLLASGAGGAANE